MDPIIKRAFDLYFNRVKPTEAEAKQMKAIEKETDIELKRYHKTCYNNSASHVCNGLGSPCEFMTD